MKAGKSTPLLEKLSVILADGYDAAIDGRGWNQRHEQARILADAAPELFQFVKAIADEGCYQLPGEYPEEIGEHGKLPCRSCQAKELIKEIIK